MPVSARLLLRRRPGSPCSREKCVFPDVEWKLCTESCRSRGLLQMPQEKRPKLFGEIESAGIAESSPSRRLGRYAAIELLEQLLAQSVKAAVRHNQQKVARLCFSRKIFRDGIRSWQGARIATQFPHARGHRFGIHAVVVAKLLRPKHSAENDAIGQGQRLRQRL